VFGDEAGLSREFQLDSEVGADRTASRTLSHAIDPSPAAEPMNTVRRYEGRQAGARESTRRGVCDQNLRMNPIEARAKSRSLSFVPVTRWDKLFGRIVVERPAWCRRSHAVWGI